MSELATIIDTETTGFDEPDVIEIGHTLPFEFPLSPSEFHPEARRRWYKPRKPIGFGAMAAHHILPKDVAEFEEWPGSWTPPEGTSYLIGHNIDYDWKAIGQPDIKRICTLAIVRRRLPDIDSHSLSAMRYFIASLTSFPEQAMGRVRERLKNAHSAVADVSSTWVVLKHILYTNKVQSWADLWELSEWCRVPEFLGFGKYGPDTDWAAENNMPKGIRCCDVKDYDRGYWNWLFSGKCKRVNEDPYLAKALRGEV